MTSERGGLVPFPVPPRTPPYRRGERNPPPPALAGFARGGALLPLTNSVLYRRWGSLAGALRKLDPLAGGSDSPHLHHPKGVLR